MPPPGTTTSKPGAKKGGSFLTQKAGPLPVWGWIAVAVVGYYLYRRYQAGQSTAGSSASNLAAATPPTESITTAGGTYTGPAGYAPSSIYNPTPGGGTAGGGGPTPGNGYTPPSGESLVGQGYQPAGSPGTAAPIVGSDQSTYYWISGAQEAPLSNQPLFFQPSPGSFVQARDPNTGQWVGGITPQTAIYAKQ